MMKMSLNTLRAIVLFMLALTTVGAAGAQDQIPDVSSLKFIRSMTVPNKDSPLHGIHHFYLGGGGEAAFVKGGPYPTGTLFVGKVYDIVEEDVALRAGALKFSTVMRKVEGEPETAGWSFAVIDVSGKPMEIEPKTMCFACHSKVKDRDYVFSKPLE